MHPPANERCQIYVPRARGGEELVRCSNTGTHWVSWPASIGEDDDPDDFYSWECDEHSVPSKGAA